MHTAVSQLATCPRALAPHQTTQTGGSVLFSQVSQWLVHILQHIAFVSNTANTARREDSHDNSAAPAGAVECVLRAQSSAVSGTSTAYRPTCTLRRHQECTEPYRPPVIAHAVSTINPGLLSPRFGKLWARCPAHLAWEQHVSGCILRLSLRKVSRSPSCLLGRPLLSLPGCCVIVTSCHKLSFTNKLLAPTCQRTLAGPVIKVSLWPPTALFAFHNQTLQPFHAFHRHPATW